MRRICRLPFGDRWLWFTPALSSSPGHAPTHEERFPWEGNVAAVAPTSAMICCAESTSRPGTSANRCTRVLMVAEQTGHLLVELPNLLFDIAVPPDVLASARELNQPQQNLLRVTAPVLEQPPLRRWRNRPALLKASAPTVR